MFYSTVLDVKTNKEITVEKLKEIINSSRGLVCFDGETGVGKTTFAKNFRNKFKIIEFDNSSFRDNKEKLFRGYIDLETLLEEIKRVRKRILIDGVFSLESLEILGITPEIKIFFCYKSTYSIYSSEHRVDDKILKEKLLDINNNCFHYNSIEYLIIYRPIEKSDYIVLIDENR